MPGVSGEFSLKRRRRRLRRIFLGLEEELQKLGADYVDRSGSERRLLDEMAERKSIFGRGKRDDETAARGRRGKGPEVEAGDDGKSAERADQELVEVVAGDVFDDAATALTEATGAVDKFRANQEVPGSAVGMAKRGVHAGGDDASDGGFEVKRDREWQELFLLVERSGEVVEVGSGIDADGEVAGIVMSDLVEGGHVEGDDVFGAHGRIGGDVGNADGGFETGGEVGHSASHGTTAARRGRQLKPGQARRLFEE